MDKYTQLAIVSFFAFVLLLGIMLIAALNKEIEATVISASYMIISVIIFTASVIIKKINTLLKDKNETNNQIKS